MYSGVLTAFVIVSFTQLQEDTAAESLKVLRIIANQTAGNAVSDQLASPAAIVATPFRPSLTAKRVNVLWFASLIISLSTASLAILVKQWLRGYMAFASSSPQGQLRIRHFRRSGLETWRVFGIASMLPLLLQISLALFFVGLCFFTADIDPAISNTTLPLVCAWALLFTIATLSPAFSARCPYKTPALSYVTTLLRTRIWLLLLCSVITAACVLLLLVLCTFILPLAGLHILFNITSKEESILSGIHRDDLIAPPIEIFTSCMQVGRGLAPEEEQDVLENPSKDLDILAAADAIQANSELELAIVKDVLKQRRPDYREALEFLVHIIGNRVPLPTKFADGPQADLIDCRLLSTRTKTGIKDLLSQYVIDSKEFRLEASRSSTQEIGDYLSWNSFSPSQQWTICVFLSLCEPDAGGRIPDVLHPLLAAWFDFILRHSEILFHGPGIRDGGTVAMFTSLCFWINLGYIARSLPQVLHGIRLRLILSDMLYELNAPHDAKDQQGYPAISKTLGRLASTAARNFGNIVFSDYWKKDTEMGRSEERCDAVLALCRIAEYMGDVGLYKEVFTPFIKESFLRRSCTAMDDILTSLFGLHWRGEESWHRPRRISNCRLLLEIAESQSPEGKFIHCQSAACTLLYLIPFDHQRTHTLLTLYALLHTVWA